MHFSSGVRIYVGAIALVVILVVALACGDNISETIEISTKNLDTLCMPSILEQAPTILRACLGYKWVDEASGYTGTVIPLGDYADTDIKVECD